MEARRTESWDDSRTGQPAAARPDTVADRAGDEKISMQTSIGAAMRPGPARGADDLARRPRRRTAIGRAAASLAACLLAPAAAAQAPIACFEEGTDPVVVERTMASAMAARSADPQPAIGTSGRWDSTALSGATGVEGDPVIVTWGIARESTVPGETTVIAAAFGPTEVTGESELQAVFDGWFGDRATWIALVQDAFDSWTDITGIEFVYEPNDDGRVIPTNGAAGAGIWGTRADIRIGGHFIDGAGGIVAYARPPDDGDIVLDTGDQSFFRDSSDNHVQFRNTVAHEIGHAMGLEHVCPAGAKTKLMEPSIVPDFDGPQHDDLVAMQDEYGDYGENDDDDVDAFDTGAGAGGTYVALDVSIDGSSDEDWVVIPPEPGLTVNVGVQPYGESYLFAQSILGSCSGTAPVLVDTLVAQDLAVQIVAADGTTEIAFADGVGAGEGETLAGVVVSSGGFVRVVGDGADAPQLYDLSVQLVPEPAAGPSAVAALVTLSLLAKRRSRRLRG